MNPIEIPGYKVVEERIKEISNEIVIEDVIYDARRMLYKFELKNNSRKCDVIFSKEFLDDLNDYTGSKTSNYWKNMISKLTSKLIESIERHGLIPYTKEVLKKLIFEYFKQLPNKEHINKFNLLGKPYQEGSLENFLKVKFNDNERAQAYIAFDELKRQGVLIPAYEDLINPEDWVKIGDKVVTNKPIIKFEKKVEDIKTEASGSPFKYDVVLSYAGEDREYVEALANKLKNSGFKVFYDRFEESNLWGKNLYDYLSDIYRNQGRYCVMFLSKHYARKLWPTYERQNAQERAFKENQEYILPIKIDDTKIPGIPDTVGYLDIREKSIEEIFNILKRKLETK